MKNQAKEMFQFIAAPSPDQMLYQALYGAYLASDGRGGIEMSVSLWKITTNAEKWKYLHRMNPSGSIAPAPTWMMANINRKGYEHMPIDSFKVEKR